MKTTMMERQNTVGTLVALAVVALALTTIAALAGSYVAPATCTFTNLREQATLSGGAATYTRGDTLLFTNCVVCSDTTGTVQQLSNVTVTIAVGNTDAATIYTATVQNAAAGTWTKSITVPTSGTVYVETRLVDESTNTYTYSGWKLLSVQSDLH